MKNLKKFNSVATSIRTFENDCDFISFVVTPERDVPIQCLRKTFDAMARKITRQIADRTEIILGSFVAFESVPAPAGESASERLDVEHPHAHVLIAIPKGQAGARRLEVFQQYGDHKVITAGRAISAAYYNCKASVFGSFTKNWQASLEHNFVQRATQLTAFHRFRATGIFRDRVLPEAEQKTIEQIEAELHEATTSTITEQENPCVPASIRNPSLESSTTTSPSSMKLAVIVKAVFKSKSFAIAAFSLEPDGIAFAAAKRVPVAAVVLR